MNEESSTIKILLKYYNYSQDEYFSNSLNEFNKTASNSNIVNNQNYRNSINSLNSSEKNNNNINKNFCNNFMNELTQDYLIHFQTNYPYNNLENLFPPKVINIKSCIYLYLVDKKKLNITLDSLLLFKYNQGKFILLNDDDSFYPQINLKIKNNPKNNVDSNNINNKTIKNKIENNISNSTIIYYNINKDKIKIIVELYSKSIDHISLNISKMCSILMLKYLILLKLREIEKSKTMSTTIEQNYELINNNISNEFINLIKLSEIITNLKIYGNGIVNNNLNEYLSKKETNRNFNNKTMISEIYNYYIINLESPIIMDNNKQIIKNIDNISISISKDDIGDGILSFIMMEKRDNKCCLGLDFRFTILQNFIPISEEENEEENKTNIISIKSYIKNASCITKYGLNLYFNCLNKNCKYNGKCFILNVGYGNYDILNLIKYNAYCPSCYKSKEDFFKEKNKKITNINDSNNLDLKYLGMINTKWAYKGYLIGIKMTNVEGKGMTVLKDILYKTKEFDFLHQFKKLIFQVERYNSKNKYKQIDSKIESSFCSNDDIHVDDKNNNIKNLNQITLDISNKTINDSDKNIIKKDIKQEKNIISHNNLLEEFKDSENKKIKISKSINNNNLFFEDNNINDNKINNIIKNEKNYYINNINEINSQKYDIMNDYMHLTKKINIKRNLNLKRKNNTSKGIYYGNAKQLIQKGDSTETNNTNIDFNIIIDKKKSNCCENCFDYQPISQVCIIF